MGNLEKFNVTKYTKAGLIKEIKNNKDCVKFKDMNSYTIRQNCADNNIILNDCKLTCGNCATSSPSSIPSVLPSTSSVPSTTPAGAGDGDDDDKAKKPRNLCIQIPQSGLGAGMVGDAQSNNMQMGGMGGFGGDGQIPTPGGLEAFPSPNQFLGVMTPNTMKEMQSFLVSPNTSGPMSLGGLPSVLEGVADGGKSG